MGNGPANYRQSVQNVQGVVFSLPSVGDVSDIKQTMPFEPYEQSVTKLFPLGTKAVDGVDVYRYARAGGTNLALAVVTQSSAPAHAAQDNDIAVQAIAAIGDYDVYITSSANLATAPNDSENAFAEGYLIVNDAGGEGQMYKIKSNDAFSGTNTEKITLYKPLITALATTSQVGLIRNPFDRTIATAAVLTGMFTGVPLIAVTTLYYYWSKTGGPAPCFYTDLIPAGTAVVVGTTAAKVSPALNTTTEVIIGYPLTPGATTDDEYMIVFLTGDR